MNPGNWLELYNKTASPVDISGWKIKNFAAAQYTIPAGTIMGANAYLVVAQDLAKFNSIFPSVTNKIGSSLLDFANNGDSIQIYDGTIRSSLMWLTKIQQRGPRAPTDGGAHWN